MVAPFARQARGFILVVVLLLAPTPLLAQGSVADVGVTFVPNFYDGEFFVPAAGAWGTVGRGATRLHFDHVVSSPDNRMSTVLTEWQVGRWGRQSILLNFGALFPHDEHRVSVFPQGGVAVLIPTSGRLFWRAEFRAILLEFRVGAGWRF